MVQRTYYAPAGPGQTAASVRVETPPANPHTVAHGYTLDDIDRFARTAVKTAFAQAMDYTERFEAAFSAVAEALCSATETPAAHELIRAGWDAVNELVRDDFRHHGVPHDGGLTTVTPSFERYWCWAARNAPSPEHRVVDEVALTQIWPSLRAGERRALLALAAHDDYARAAAALGLKYQSLHTQVRNARLRFLVLWHESEQPSQLWGRDRRRWRQDVDPSQVKEHRPVTVRRRAAVKRTPPKAAPGIPHGIAGYQHHRCRCDICCAAKSAEGKRQRAKNGTRGAEQ